jgi:hypothetical protein
MREDLRYAVSKHFARSVDELAQMSLGVRQIDRVHPRS